jgi:diguanylate cyclase (GGDEF)-like protein
MTITHQSLLEQLRITKREIIRRKEYFNLTEEDKLVLEALHPLIADRIDEVVDTFYQNILKFNEIDRLIGDASTLDKLRNHLRAHILSLFEGNYDEEYVHSRLRVGVVHKRIGVEPKYFVSAVHNLANILENIAIYPNDKDCSKCITELSALRKILMFDLSLTFETYIHSLMDEVRRSKEELERYAESLEETISERTRLLKEQVRHDGLTNLLNQHYFYKELRRELARGLRRSHSTSLIYFDLDGFKQLNDTQGHRTGDQALVTVAKAITTSIRENDIAARYGGDEFCVILPESSSEESEFLCRRILKVIENHIADYHISCSMGLATSTPERYLDATSLVKKADEAMYTAKQKTGFTLNIAPE